MKERMKTLAESLGMPPGLGGGPGMWNISIGIFIWVRLSIAYTVRIVTVATWELSSSFYRKFNSFSRGQRSAEVIKPCLYISVPGAMTIHTGNS